MGGWSIEPGIWRKADIEESRKETLRFVGIGWNLKNGNQHYLGELQILEQKYQKQIQNKKLNRLHKEKMDKRATESPSRQILEEDPKLILLLPDTCDIYL